MFFSPLEFNSNFSSLIIFFVPFGALFNEIVSNGRSMSDLAVLEFTVFTALIVVVNGKIILETEHWTILNHIAIWGSILLYVAFVLVFYEGMRIL